MTREPLALALLKPPGEFGVDIAVGEGQSLGVPIDLGGPAFGFFASQKKFVRNIPGRLVGATVDSQERRGLRADPGDPGAAYPAREGDIQYLHQSNPVRIGCHGLYVALGQVRLAAHRRDQSGARPQRCRSISRAGET